VRDLVLAGGVRRPTLASLRPDWRAAKFLARVGYRALGDDGLLSAIVKELEREGFRVIGADQLLREASLPEGPLGRFCPDTDALADIAHGMRLARAIGALDIGQAVVVQQGLVLGVEAIEGTDGLLRRCGALRRDGPGGVLVKMEKPGQERRADRPTIGPQTVSLAAESGLRGIAAGAGATLVLDPDEVIRLADEAGIFVVGVRPR
ncbi:MAG TPA: UDP-2,3-diacylglucosamine diphosphatase LpxI, partial [Stellaceae bacterium]|nr:UDP-2,3-diacylglucosamine diphosphatase LpxI [Stellaceae bacterium]